MRIKILIHIHTSQPPPHTHLVHSVMKSHVYSIRSESEHISRAKIGGAPPAFIPDLRHVHHERCVV